MLVGLGGLEPPASRLSGARSNQLNYKPITRHILIYCPRIYSHYRDHGRRQISYGDFNVRTECTFRRKRSALVNAEQNACLPTSITKEQVLKEYLPKGYVNFKISGRFNPGSIIEETTKWFILPEYQSDFREVCVNKIFHFAASFFKKLCYKSVN